MNREYTITSCWGIFLVSRFNNTPTIELALDACINDLENLEATLEYIERDIYLQFKQYGADLLNRSSSDPCSFLSETESNMNICNTSFNNIIQNGIHEMNLFQVDLMRRLYLSSDEIFVSYIGMKLIRGLFFQVSILDIWEYDREF